MPENETREPVEATSEGHVSRQRNVPKEVLSDVLHQLDRHRARMEKEVDRLAGLNDRIARSLEGEDSVRVAAGTTPADSDVAPAPGLAAAAVRAAAGTPEDAAIRGALAGTTPADVGRSNGPDADWSSLKFNRLDPAFPLGSFPPLEELNDGELRFLLAELRKVAEKCVAARAVGRLVRREVSRSLRI